MTCDLILVRYLSRDQRKEAALALERAYCEPHRVRAEMEALHESVSRLPAHKPALSPYMPQLAIAMILMAVQQLSGNAGLLLYAFEVGPTAQVGYCDVRRASADVFPRRGA
jgi:hypothetical protein